MPMKEFIVLSGYPDSVNGTLEKGTIVWESSAWEGIFSGGTVEELFYLQKKGESFSSLQRI